MAISSTNTIETETLSTLSHNLCQLLKAHQMNESELARNLNIAYNTIHRLLMGTTADPKLSTLQQIADYFQISLDTLLSPQGAANPLEIAQSIPILSWEVVQSPNFAERLADPIWLKIPVAMKDKNTLNNHCFALESTRSMQPRFPLGTTFIFKPEESPLDGDLVLVRFKESQNVSLRELVIDSPHWQLNPIVPGSTSLPFEKNQVEIIGVVVLTIIQTNR